MSGFEENVLYETDDDEFRQSDYMRIRTDNERVIEQFGEYLGKKGAPEGKIFRILGNADYFLNNYLLDVMDAPASSGPSLAFSFFDEFLVEAGLAEEEFYRGMLSSVKRLYSFMAETGMIPLESFEEMKRMLNDKKPYWIEMCNSRQYAGRPENDPDSGPEMTDVTEDSLLF